jgi:hypothetical protein
MVFLAKFSSYVVLPSAGLQKKRGGEQRIGFAEPMRFEMKAIEHSIY